MLEEHPTDQMDKSVKNTLAKQKVVLKAGSYLCTLIFVNFISTYGFDMVNLAVVI